MKHTLYKYIAVLFAVLPLALLSCSGESSEPVPDGQVRKVLLNFSFSGFDSSTRAGEQNYNIKEGDKMYIDFDGFKTYASYREKSEAWELNELPDSASGIVRAYFPSSLSAYSAPFVGEGTFSNTAESLTVAVTLTPATSRLRFHGEAGKKVAVSGLSYYTYFDTGSYTYRSEIFSGSLPISSSGYTDYIYVLFTEDVTLDITYNGNTFQQSFPANTLKLGGSGYYELLDNTLLGEGFGEDEDWNDTHESVDLGLSVKWATYNVGAEYPQEYGNYYAWGETEPKDYYSWYYYKWMQSGQSSWKYITKYQCPDNQTTGIWYYNYSFVGDNKSVLDPEDDVAHVKWGGSWRMPTKDEVTELLNNCSKTWTTLNGVTGCYLTGPNGNRIFLPAAGYLKNGSGSYIGSECYYWTSSVNPDGSDYANYFVLKSSSKNISSDERYLGRPVRPVHP